MPTDPEPRPVDEWQIRLAALDQAVKYFRGRDDATSDSVLYVAPKFEKYLRGDHA
jgi:hypothetical protein